MKTAVVQPLYYIVLCPQCFDALDKTDTSSQWTLDELEPGRVMECHNCHIKVQIPGKNKQVYG